MARSVGIKTNPDYFFRLTINQPLRYKSIYDRLQFYLNILAINDGETPHSFRGDCAVALRQHLTKNANENTAPDALMQHMGWANPWSAAHYARVDQASAISEAMARSAYASQSLQVFESNFVDEAEL